jgi:hypothetical protein
MYEISNAEAPLYQGDIFGREFVFPFTADFDEETHLVREDRVIPASQIPDAWTAGSEIILTQAFRTRFAIILSNTCEISGEKQPLEFVTMGSIFPIDTITKGERRESCVRNKIFRFHHLQAHECGFPASYVHFGMLAQVKLETLKDFRASRILALRSPHRENLGHRFAEFLGRVAV